MVTFAAWAGSKAENGDVAPIAMDTVSPAKMPILRRPDCHTPTKRRRFGCPAAHCSLILALPPFPAA